MYSSRRGPHFVIVVRNSERFSLDVKAARSKPQNPDGFETFFFFFFPNQIVEQKNRLKGIIHRGQTNKDEWAFFKSRT